MSSSDLIADREGEEARSTNCSREQACTPGQTGSDLLSHHLSGDIGDPAAALALLAGYATTAPLGRADIEAIVRLLPLVHLEFALSEIEYFTAVVEDPASAALAWDGYLIGHAEWFLSDPGRSFLDAIEARATRR